MLATTNETRCHRCLEPMTLHVAGDDYCRKCKAETRARDDAEARRQTARARFRVVKDLSVWPQGAA